MFGTNSVMMQAPKGAIVKRLELSEVTRKALGHDVYVWLNSPDGYAAQLGNALTELAAYENGAAEFAHLGAAQLKVHAKTARHFIGEGFAILWGAGPDGTGISADMAGNLAAVLGEREARRLMAETVEAVREYQARAR